MAVFWVLVPRRFKFTKISEGVIASIRDDESWLYNADKYQLSTPRRENITCCFPTVDSNSEVT
jgi:hypothetical protein